MESNNKIIFFDGECNFCNGTVDFVFKRNGKKDIKYSSNQSDFAQKFLAAHFENEEKIDLETIYYFRNNRLYTRSTAVLMICKDLNFPFPLLSAFLIIPKALRDWCYSLFAKHRYSLFGRKDSCRLISKEEEKFFLA